MRAVNLIPAEQREGAGGIAGRSEGAALIVLAMIAGLAIMALLYGSAQRSESKSRAQLATVNAELASAKAQAGRLAPYTSFISMAEQRMSAVKQLVASRFDWSHAFNELGRVLPSDASLSGLQGQVGGSTTAGGAPTPPAAAGAAAGAAAAGSAPTSATPPGSTPAFTITGCATSQSEVAQTLQRLRLIDGVTNVTLQSSVKSASGATSSSGASSGSSSNCGSGAAAFSVTVTFTALPSAPATNTTPAAPGTGAAGAQPSAPSGNQAVTVSSSQGGAK